MDDNISIKLGRRRLILRAGTLSVVGLGAAACVPAQPLYVQPAPPVVVRGTGITDADPNDGPGNGRGGFRGGGTGITDADPNDGPGRGRGGYRGGGYRTGTGITDSDPSDGPGRGRGGARAYRGGYNTGVTDSDPSDGPGRGRRGY